MKSKEQLELEKKLDNLQTPCSIKCPIGKDGESIDCYTCINIVRLKIISEYCVLKVKGTSESTTPIVIE